LERPDDLQASQAVSGRWNWTRVFILLAASLTATVGFTEGNFEILRIGGIQYLELIYLFQIFLLIIAFPTHKFQARLLRPAFNLGLFYSIFLVAAFVLAILALQRDFYYPTGIGILKFPVWITLSRMTELFIDVASMLYLFDLFRSNLNNLIFALRIYFWVGVASGVFAIITYPLNVYFDLQLGTYLDQHRMRGFYNEGGPYGLYLLSVFLVGIVLARQDWVPRSRIRLAYVPLVIALLGSQSKAAIFAGGLMMFFNALMARQIGRRLFVIMALVGMAFLISLDPAITQTVTIYIDTPAKYEYLSNLESDQDLLSGRVAGAFIVRRMIQVHPWVGIGWGNYPLVRNSPEYRGGAKWADIDDDPGLGMLGTTADFGVPLTLFLVFITFYPYLYLRRRGVPLVVKNLALIQPVVHLCGAQLNLTYPWLITAFALGLGYYHTRNGLQAYIPQLAPAGPEGPRAQSLPAPSA
jgi:hypothetical protein